MAKNYQIVSFYDGGRRFWDVNANGHYEYKGNAPHVPFSLEYMLESLKLDDGRHCKIYSVKRLSDGKIFKIGDEMREIFKDPITDDGTKKSKKGLLKVTEVALLVPDTGEKTVPIKTTLVVKDQCNWNEEKRGLLETVFLNGELTKAQTLKEIRERLNKQ